RAEERARPLPRARRHASNMRPHRASPLAPLTAAVIAATLCAVPSIASAQPVPELPRAIVDVTPPPPPGRTIAVTAGGDLQAAIDAAQPGDSITLAAGAAFSGKLRLLPQNATPLMPNPAAAPHTRRPPPGTTHT